MVSNYNGESEHEVEVLIPSSSTGTGRITPKINREISSAIKTRLYCSRKKMVFLMVCFLGVLFLVGFSQTEEIIIQGNNNKSIDIDDNATKDRNDDVVHFNQNVKSDNGNNNNSEIDDDDDDKNDNNTTKDRNDDVVHFNQNVKNDNGNNNNSEIDDDDDDKNDNNGGDDHVKNDDDDDVTVLTNHDKIKSLQRANFQNGSSIILNIHITHHAGTTFCGVFRVVGAPRFACMGPKDEINEEDRKEWDEMVNFQGSRKPWSYNETSRNIDIVRKHYRMLSWELGQVPRRPLSRTNWEDPNLVSVIVMRNPLTRLLSNHGQVFRTHFHLMKDAVNFTHDQWWWYAHDSDLTDNFALQRLTDKSFNYLRSSNIDDFDLDELDKDIDPRDMIESAKNLLKRFTYVLDIECLSEGMQALADDLGIDIESATGYVKTKEKSHQKHPSSIPYDDIAKFLEYRNRVDIELYEWSKTISLVKCKDLPK